MITDDRGWGVPDWRDEGAYANTESRLLWQWRWDFTRRRDDYRRIWKDYYQKTVLDIVNCVGNWREEFGVNRADEMIYSERFLAVIPYEDEDGPETIKWFGLRGLINPCIQHLSKDPFESKGFGECYYSTMDDESWRDLYEKGKFIFTFDANQPAEPQILKARILLEARCAQSGQRRKHVNKWPQYLRVIDARNNNATWETIARDILRVQRNEAPAARQVWEQAQQLMFNWPG